MQNYILCSKCFFDEGLKLTCERFGKSNKIICPSCKKSEGHKISKADLEEVCWEFFINGTAFEAEFGGASLLSFNQFQKTEVKFNFKLNNDIKLIEKELGIGFFYNAPRLFKLGYITQLEKINSKDIIQEFEVLDEIIQKFPSRILTNEDYFYRLRKNPKNPDNELEYDSPPIEYAGKGRLDSIDLNILYGSENIEICLHECRVTLLDKLYLAKLVPTQNLKILDLSADINDDAIEFESLSLSIHFIFRAEKHAYEICRKISKYALLQGFDGIIYPSFFSKIKSDSIPNIALFDFPLKNNKVKVESINRVIIDKIQYDYTFGPVIDD
nr:RES family NAD+ phosphorylase [uncultured Chryseobacterium sp.]